MPVHTMVSCMIKSWKFFFFKSVVSGFPCQSFNTMPHYLIFPTPLVDLDERAASEEDDEDSENSMLQEEHQHSGVYLRQPHRCSNSETNLTQS